MLDWRKRGTVAGHRGRVVFEIQYLASSIQRLCSRNRLLILCMNAITSTILLLVASNCFMTYAWYGQLKSMSHKPLIIAVLASWGVAFFEYLLQVPANRIGYGHLTLPQLKMLQEVITLTVFVPFSIYIMRQPVKLDFLWASLCMCGAVYFMFRGTPVGN